MMFDVGCCLVHLRSFGSSSSASGASWSTMIGSGVTSSSFSRSKSSSSVVILSTLEALPFSAFGRLDSSNVTWTDISTIKVLLLNTLYELYRGKKPNVEHFRAFGCRCFVLNNGKDHLRKFDSKANEGIFLGYNSNSASYKIFNKRTLIVETSIHVTFDESNLSKVENGSASHIDKLTTELEDLDLLKDDESILEPTTVEQDVPEAVEELPKERR